MFYPIFWNFIWFLFFLIIEHVGLDDFDEDEKMDRKPDHIPQEGEPDFIETNCHWENCSSEFDCQDELVKVSFVKFTGT